MAGGEGAEPDRIFDQYRICVDEYRFQVELNWKRSQYYFVLNALILVAGVGLLNAETRVPPGVVAALFGVGALTALLAMLTTHTQNTYYRASRDQVKVLADAVGLGDLALKTTPTLAGHAVAKRLGRVTTFQYLILLTLASADIAGAVLALCD